MLASRSLQRHDGRDAELDRLAHDDVHRVGRDDRLHERHGPRRFALHRIVAIHVDNDIAPIDARNRRGIFAPGPGEERHRISGPHPQRLRDVAGRGFGEREVASGNRRMLVGTDEDAWRDHGRCYDSPMT